nr:Dyp-type peroxidase domain-containing protein [Rahnella bruchi]
MLRRSYNYTDGLNNMAQLDAGLLFISYQKDPAQFEALQTKLGASDALNEYISHIGSGIFFVPRHRKKGLISGRICLRPSLTKIFGHSGKCLVCASSGHS